MVKAKQWQARVAWSAAISAVLASAAGSVLAQSVPPVGNEKPGLPTQLHYTSPIGAYKRHVDQPMGGWRAANDQVGRIGGWKAYAKEAQAAEPRAKMDMGPAGAPMNPHAGHHGGSKP